MKILKQDYLDLYDDVKDENEVLWKVLKQLKIKTTIKETPSPYIEGHIVQSIKFEGNGECVGVTRILSEEIQELKRHL